LFSHNVFAGARVNGVEAQRCTANIDNADHVAGLNMECQMKKLLITATVILLSGTSAFAGPHYYFPTGNGNFANVYQWGNGNYGPVTQTGNHNTGIVSQVGGYNVAPIYQSGNYNTAIVSQFGFGNTATIIQN
jgi:hypothetical protein